MYYVLKSSDDVLKACDGIGGTPLDGNYAVEIKPHKKDRSLAQNRLYRMWVNIISKETGENDDKIHGYLMDALGHFELVKWRGRLVPVAISSSKLTVEQFSELIDACEALAKELNIKLVYPMDYMFARYGNAKN